MDCDGHCSDCKGGAPRLVVMYVSAFTVIGNLLINLTLTVGVRTHIPLRDEDYNTTWMYVANGDGDTELAYLLEPPPEVERNMPMFIQLEYYNR